MRYLDDLTDKFERTRGALDFVQHVKAVGLAQIQHRPAGDILADSIGPDRAARFAKAAVGGHGTGDTDAARARLSRDFVAGLLPATVLGQLAGALQAPTNTRVPSGQLDVVGDFIAQGASYPIVSAYIASQTLGPTKLGLIAVLANELLRLADPAPVDRVLRRALVRGANRVLLSEAAAVVDERPAGLLHGVSAVDVGSPGDLAAALVDVAVACRGGAPDAPIWVLSPLAAVYLQAQDARFQKVSAHPSRPGELFGMPQIASEAAGTRAILIDANGVVWNSDGILIESSGSTTLQMDDAPSGDALTGAGASLVSMFQTSAVAVKADWYLGWSRLDPDCVAWCELPLPVGSPAW